MDSPEATLPGGSRAVPVDSAPLWYHVRTPLNEIMSRSPVTISLDATMGEARDLMVRRRFTTCWCFRMPNTSVCSPTATSCNTWARILER